MSLLEQAIDQACPPSWERDSWNLFVVLCRSWWPEPEANWTKDRLLGLGMGMADFTAEQAGEALKSLKNSGQKFPPRVPEIANAVHVDRSAPSWTEAHALMFDHPAGVIHARLPAGARPVGEEERWKLRALAMLARAEQLHEMVAAFVAAYGARRLEQVSGRIAYGEYGAVELERLRVEWEDFVERADARRREGLPLLTAPLARRELGGPRRLNPLAHLTAPAGAAAQS